MSLARTALEHGLNANLLRKWVVKQTGVRPARARALAIAAPRVALLPVTTTEPPQSTRAAQPQGYLELLLAGGTIRVHGRVDPQVLSMAVACLARRP